MRVRVCVCCGEHTYQTGLTAPSPSGAGGTGCQGLSAVAMKAEEPVLVGAADRPFLAGSAHT